MSDIFESKPFRLERLLRQISGCEMTVTATESELEQYGKDHFHAGLKRGAAIASPIKGIISTNQWEAGYQEGRKDAEQAILREISDEKETS